MKDINVDSHNVPATARSKNYQTALATTAASGGGATTPSVVTPTGGAADTAKVAQNLAEDSTDWAKILRKDIDERTENALSIGKNITVDGQAILNDVVANTGTFGGMLKAAAATITGALLASTVSATTMNATTFIGELQGNAATATKLQTPRTIWGQSFDGSSDVAGDININGTLHTTGKALLESELFVKKGIIIGENTYSLDGIPFHGVVMGHTGVNTWNFGEYGGNFEFFRSFDPSYNATLIARINTNNNYLLGNLGIGTTTPQYKLDVNGNARISSDIYADATVGTRNFASRTTGWRADSQGNADFRNIYSDELRVQAFTADISQALAGSDYLTKSVSKLSANFVVPSVNSTVRIIVDDIEGMPATQCFSNNDYIRFRAFNRTSGLTIANVWGTVTLDTTFGTNGFLNGTQAYTFTCKQTSGAGLTVFKGSEVLDYGTSGSGMISRTTLDAQGSPYEQIATWVNDPSNGNNYTVHARLGNLGGIANCSGYGVYTDNGFFTGKVTVGDLTKTNHYLDFSNGALTVKGNIYLSSGYAAVSTFDMSNGISLAVDNIHVATRNLLRGINSTYDCVTSWGNWGITSSKELYISNSYYNALRIANLDSSKNREFVLSFDAYVTTSNYYSVVDRQDTLVNTSVYNITNGHNVCNIIVPQGVDLFRLNFYGDSQTSGPCVLYNIQLAVGNKETPFNIAPEDVDASINLKVSKDGVIGAINLTSEAATIQASKINLVGAVTISAIDKSSVTPSALGAATPTDVSTAVNGIQIGGRNLLKGTRLLAGSSFNGWVAVGSTVIANDYSSFTSVSNSYKSSWYDLLAWSNVITPTPNTYYVLSFYAKSTVEGDTITSYFYPNTQINIGDGATNTTLTTEWAKYVVTWHTKSDISGVKSIIIARIPDGKGTGTVSVCGVKFEEGNKATDWSPAPEDVDANISTAQSTADTALTRNNTMAVKLGYTDYDALASAAALGHTLIDGGMINTVLINATAVVTNGLTANCITSDKVNMSEFTASNGFVDSFNANVIATKRLDVAKIVADGIAAQTIDAQSATISNLNVVNATVNGYFHAEYSGGAFVRMGQPTSSKILDIRADSLTGIRVGVYGDNSTGLSITSNGNSSKALDIHGSNYLITRQFSVPEGTWINGLSLCRVTITSGGDLGFGSLGWYQNGGYYMPNLIISKASSNITVYIPADMADGAVLIFRNAGDGTLNVSSKNFADKFQWGAQWDDWSKPYAPVVPGSLMIMVYDKESHTWYVHGIS